MSINKPQYVSQQLNSLSDRLILALRELGVTQTELAERVNTTKQVINYLCNTKVQSSKLSFVIAKALGINEEWLAKGVGFMRPEDDPEYVLMNNQKRVPVVLSSQLRHLQNNAFQPNNDIPISEWLLTNAEASDKSFAMRLQDKSMYPRFDQGTLIVINPDRKPKDKEFVLAYINTIDDYILRQLEISDLGSILKPMNTVLNLPLVLSEADTIVGVMVEARWQM